VTDEKKDKKEEKKEREKRPLPDVGPVCRGGFDVTSVRSKTPGFRVSKDGAFRRTEADRRAGKEEDPRQEIVRSAGHPISRKSRLFPYT